MADEEDERDRTADEGAGEGDEGGGAADRGADEQEARSGRDEPDDGGEDDGGGDDDDGGDEVAELEEEVEELEDEVKRLRERLAELEGELSGLRKGSTTARWASWLLGTFAVGATLALVVIVLGHGLPTGGSDQPGGSGGSSDQEEALNALVMEHADELQACLDDWASSSEVPDGTVVAAAIDIEAGEQGAVARVNVTGEGVAPRFASCLERAVSAWVFPGPGAYLLQAPFEVRRGRGSDEGAAPAPDSGGRSDGPLSPSSR